MINQDQVFKDLIVVELASALAGPAAGLFFAELGAKVIKIENARTGGDVTRRWKHATENKKSPFSAYYYSVNWGKEVHLLDLQVAKDKHYVQDLIKKADIVIANFRPGSGNRLGFDYDQVRLINPGVIYANVTAYGPEDPRPGFDAAIQAETGWMDINGQKEGPPTKVPLAIVDLLTGHQLKQGILVALIQRMKTGEGAQVNVSLFDASLASMANQAANVLNLNVAPQREGSRHPSIVPYGDIVTSKDGRDYLLAVGTEDQFKQLCHLIDQPLYEDDRFRDNQQRLKFRDELVIELQKAVAQMNGDDFESRCNMKGVPVGAINSLYNVLKEDEARDLIHSHKYDDHHSGRSVRTVVFKLTE